MPPYSTIPSQLVSITQDDKRTYSVGCTGGYGERWLVSMIVDYVEVMPYMCATSDLQHL